MKITVIGTGYVGLVTGACFAEMGTDVLCLDVDAAKIEALKKGVIPIFEPGLEELVERNGKEGRLRFSTDYAEGAAHGRILFIAVGTPEGEDGSADLQHVLAVARSIGEHMDGYRIVVTKSTVPVGTGERVADEIRAALARRGVELPFAVVSNPEFLKEGNAVQDFLKPDRVIIGSQSAEAIEELRELYGPFMLKHDRVITMDLRSAEMTKYAANAMLATKISFINEVANICEAVGADVSQVRLGMCSDHRIGYEFLYPGAGYGGSCFPKDVKALVRTARGHDYDPELLASVDAVNTRQKSRVSGKILGHFEAKGIAPESASVALWGVAFKPNTDDVREAPALTVIRELLAAGVAVTAFDPIAAENAKRVLGDPPKLRFADSPYEALRGADALAILTEWSLFRRPDFERMKALMAAPVIFDGRNIYEPKQMEERGFAYHGIGRRG